MKLLLDENLPKKLKLDFLEHEIYTVKDMEWQGVKNGQLLELMVQNKFDALLTFDKNLQHQQNFSKYTLTVFILQAEINTYEALTILSTKILDIMNSESMMTQGPVVISNFV